MIEESGVILGLEGGLAVVQTERRSTCGGCRAGGSCATSWLDRLLGRRPVLLKARNGIGAGPGDLVVVGVEESDLLRAAVMAYLVPVLALVLGAILGQALAGVIGSGSDLPVLLCGAAAFALALLRLRRYSAALEGAQRHRPVVLRRLAAGGASRPVAFVQPR